MIARRKHEVAVHTTAKTNANTGAPSTRTEAVGTVIEALQTMTRKIDTDQSGDVGISVELSRRAGTGVTGLAARQGTQSLQTTRSGVTSNEGAAHSPRPKKDRVEPLETGMLEQADIKRKSLEKRRQGGQDLRLRILILLRLLLVQCRRPRSL